MNQNFFYKVKGQKVINETVEGETIIINFESGNYYRLDGIGSDIWGFLQKGSRLSEILSYLSANYDHDGKALDKDIVEFISRLEAEDLITGQEVAKEPDTASEKRALPEKRPAFAIPNIEKYEDMQAFLLADPIHEVEESGWPNLKK